MKKYFNISFQWYDTNTYCSNIAHAETAEDVTAHYTAKGHAWVGEPTECSQYDIESAQRKGMPIVEIEPAAEPQEEPAEIAVATLADDLDLGDHADRLNDYRDSSTYICDAISEIADSDTSIYYSDILDFIRENPEALADVVAEGLYEVSPGVEYDLYKHGQAAEYMTIERDIYAHMRDAVLLCAVDFIRYDLRRETIPAELAELIEEWADAADNNDRMDDIPDKIREYFTEAEESEEN